jgi:hypothetical protein
MALLMSEQFAEQESLHNKMKQMFAYDSEQARDAVLAGSIAEIRDKISEMENVGVDMICIPTFVREIPRKELDQFMSTVAVSFQT